LRGRRFLDLLPDAIDDCSGSICVRNDTGERFPAPREVRRPHRQENSGLPGALLRALAIGCAIS
jgi:hypothetical protein